MVDLPQLRSDNPSLTLPTLQQLFLDLCSSSQTPNQTTSMFLAPDTTTAILAKHGVTSHVTELLAACSIPESCSMEGECSPARVYTPALLSLLQAATAPSTDKVFALIIVDVQNDFISGSLAVNEGEMVVPVINRLGELFKHVYKTVDWHPANHISFFSNVKKGLYPTSHKSEIAGADSEMFDCVVVAGPPELQQTLWPDHCIQGSHGAEFHPDLGVFPGEVSVNKGMDKMVDSYSGFWDNGDTSHTPLYSYLLEQGVTDVVVCGIAMDYCVGFTALDAARHGFRTVVVEEAVRGVAPATVEVMVARCRAAGVEFVKESEVPGIVGEKEDGGRQERIAEAMEHFMKTVR